MRQHKILAKLAAALLLCASGAAAQTVGPPPSPAGGVACTGDFCTATAPLSGALGGTGVANTSKTLTLGGNLTTSGAFASTFTMTGTTGVTFPTSGTLATTSAGSIPLTALAAQAADTVVMNASGSAASPTAVALSSCSTSSSALTYNTSTHAWGCNTSINAATLGGATFAAPGAIGSGSPGTGVFSSLTVSSGANAFRVGPSASAGTQTTVSVNGGASAGSYVCLSAGDSCYAFFGNGNAVLGSNANDTVLQATSGNGVHLQTNGSSTDRITLTSGGLVQFPSVGTDAATADSTACISTTGKTLLTGTGTIGICLGTSSARFKHGIAPLSDGISQILALRPVNFFYNKGHVDGGEREQYGFIAEDVVGVIPKLVGLDEQNKPNSVDILGIVPILVKGMQEQQHQIDLLRVMLGMSVALTLVTMAMVGLLRRGK